LKGALHESGAFQWEDKNSVLVAIAAYLLVDMPERLVK